uniref:Uncharacterized protein n=1 Tax=Anas platyrhynchos TaxID=8839 RepID=A0A8B9TKZ9_ANAPL
VQVCTQPCTSQHKQPQHHRERDFSNDRHTMLDFILPFRRLHLFENEAHVVTACLNFPLTRAVRLPPFCRSPHVGSLPLESCSHSGFIYQHAKLPSPHASTNSTRGWQGQHWSSPG